MLIVSMQLTVPRRSSTKLIFYKSHMWKMEELEDGIGWASPEDWQQRSRGKWLQSWAPLPLLLHFLFSSSFFPQKSCRVSLHSCGSQELGCNSPQHVSPTFGFSSPPTHTTELEFHDDYIPVADSTHHPCPPAQRCGFSVCHHTHVGNRVRECVKNDSEMVFWWWIFGILSVYVWILVLILIIPIDLQLLWIYTILSYVYFSSSC